MSATAAATSRRTSLLDASKLTFQRPVVATCSPSPKLVSLSSLRSLSYSSDYAPHLAGPKIPLDPKSRADLVAENTALKAELKDCERHISLLSVQNKTFDTLLRVHRSHSDRSGMFSPPVQQVEFELMVSHACFMGMFLVLSSSARLRTRKKSASSGDRSSRRSATSRTWTARPRRSLRNATS
jgi:hypothetical protein